MAHGWRQPTLTMITTPRLSPHVAREHRSSLAPEGPFDRTAISLPNRSIRALAPWLASPRFKAPVVPGSHTQTRSPQIDRRASQPVGTTAPTSPRSHRPPVTQSVALEAIVQVLGSRLSGLSRTSEEPRSPLGQVRPPRLRRAAAVAPFGYNYAGDEQSGGITQLANTSVGAISTALPSQTQTLAVSRPKTARGKSNRVENSNDKGSETGQGDLYLEGSVLGRWLTQHLNREIVRPRAGIMAVNPRITPSWGGPSLAT